MITIEKLESGYILTIDGKRYAVIELSELLLMVKEQLEPDERP